MQRKEWKKGRQAGRGEECAPGREAGRGAKSRCEAGKGSLAGAGRERPAGEILAGGINGWGRPNLNEAGG